MVFIVCNSYFMDRLMQVLKDCGIDYFTSWDKAKGKGHGTDPHLGMGAHSSLNAVTMIAFQEEKPLADLIAGIQAANKDIRRPADHIRLFQVPMDRMV